MTALLSVITVAYNSAEVLPRFLASIPPGVPVIVADNASTDASAAIAERSGAHVLRLARNLGYGAACNAAAAHADSEWLVFANPDIVFESGAVEALLSAARAHPGAAFNPRIYDGARRRFRTWSRLLPREKFWKGPPPETDSAVPVLSGACLMVRKSDFDRIGGFDPGIFLFHEDDDLSLRLKEAGVELRLAHDAVVRHAAGRSSARSPRTGRIKGVAMGRSLVHVMNKHGRPLDLARERRRARLKLILPHVLFNGARRAKHLGFLSGLQDEGGRGRPLSLRRVRRSWRGMTFALARAVGLGPGPGPFVPGGRPAVLMIDRVYPRADRDSGSLDAIAFVRIFQDLGYRVLFAPDVEFAEDSHYRARLEALGAECVAADGYWSIGHFLHTHGKEIGLFFLSRAEAGGRYIEAVRRIARKDARIVLNLVDLGSLREARRASLERKWRLRLRSFRTRRRELAAVRLADASIVVSHEEERMLREAVPGARVFTVPLVRDVPGRAGGFEARAGIGFIGGYAHRPNVDAVHYFLDEIWPRVRARLPGARFIAIGADMPESLRRRTDEGFEARGHVAGLGDLFSGLRLTVAPLRYGAGAKGKVVTSLSHGVPCVVSPVAAEGMNLRDRKEVLVAAAPEDFADRIVELYTDEALWNALSDEGLETVRREHGFERGRAKMREILEYIEHLA